MQRSILLIFLAIAFFSTLPSLSNAHSAYGVRPTNCPKGWLQYAENCYFRQPDLMSFGDAKKSCERRNAAIFEVNDTFEMDAVRKLFPDYYFTWVSAEIEEELEWLHEPYEEVINGKSKVAECIGYYSSPTSKSYMFWYPCVSRFHSICEKPLDSFRQWVQ